MKPCNDAKVKTFDYSRLTPAFTKISKPAKRALANNSIYNANDLAQ
jgi:hypothetical protein